MEKLDKNDLLTRCINRARTLDTDFDEKLRWQTEVKGQHVDTDWLFKELIRVLGKKEVEKLLKDVKKLENTSKSSNY